MAEAALAIACVAAVAGLLALAVAVKNGRQSKTVGGGGY